MNPETRLVVSGIVILSLVIGFFIFGIQPQLRPVWTDQGKIVSIGDMTTYGFIHSWVFQTITQHHGNQTVESDCNNEFVNNTIYVSLLGSGKYAQTDASGNISCVR